MDITLDLDTNHLVLIAESAIDMYALQVWMTRNGDRAVAECMEKGVDLDIRGETLMLPCANNVAYYAFSEWLQSNRALKAKRAVVVVDQIDDAFAGDDEGFDDVH